MKKILIILLIVPTLLSAQRDFSNIEVAELAPGLHRLFIANSVSVVVFHGDNGTLVIDAAYEQSADALMNTIATLSDQPVKYLLNTHLHGDHTGGNKVIGKDASIIAHPSVKEYLSKDQQRGENVIPAFPDYAQPDILVEKEMELEFNGERIQITHMPGGHTGGDLTVFFPDSRVLVMGDLLFAKYFPYVDTGNGGNPLRFMQNVETIIKKYPEDITFVGGHGPVFTHSDLKGWYTDLMQTMEVVREGKKEGLSVEEMKSQRILKDWAGMGGFFITEDRWIDTIYPYL